MSIRAHFVDIRPVILQELSQAQTSIQVAVAWITDQATYTLLLEKCALSISVTVIIRNDVINVQPGGLDWQQLIEAGGTLYFSSDYPALHHKFCIVDGKQVLTGSYNWTYAAQRNHENIVVAGERELINSYRQAFGKLLNQAHEVENVATAILASPPASDAALQQQAAMDVKFRQKEETAALEANTYEQLLRSANAAYLQKQYQLAEAHLGQAIKSQTLAADAHQLLASVYWRTEQFEKAIAAAQQAEADGPCDATLWNTMGLAYHGLKQFKQAIASFDRCILAAPNIATWHANKCFALDESGRESLGDQAALEAVRLASNEIKKYKGGGNDHRLLRSYIERSLLRTDLPEARKDAQGAREVYNRLPVEEQDLHDLEYITKKLK